MFKVGALFIATGLIAFSVAPIAVRADSAMGQLVYSFTYSSNQAITARDSANPIENPAENGELSGGNNGISHYAGTLNDKGTMTVVVLHQQPDGGLVVTISEEGQNVRRAPAAMCVVYGNTNVICDPNKTVYTEEYTLLRFLGSNFVDPAQVDANRHWAVSQDSGNTSVKADYTINSNNNGMMQIGENRKIRRAGGGSLTTDVQTKIGYDFKRSVPTSVDEYVQQRHDNGVVGTSTTIYQTTLNLVSDSMAAKT
ncbi:MAG TPA: hypothetical protein VFE35_02240 [Candidatus Cybelea sp.]|jgi:hypothetical protein|nr:hypothetical protein [Candidatus Cybelea sp.]